MRHRAQARQRRMTTGALQNHVTPSTSSEYQYMQQQQQHPLFSIGQPPVVPHHPLMRGGALLSAGYSSHQANHCPALDQEPFNAAVTTVHPSHDIDVASLLGADACESAIIDDKSECMSTCTDKTTSALLGFNTWQYACTSSPLHVSPQDSLCQNPAAHVNLMESVRQKIMEHKLSTSNMYAAGSSRRRLFAKTCKAPWGKIHPPLTPEQTPSLRGVHDRQA